MKPRILVVRPDKLGEVLATTPLFPALREAYPHCHLTVWVHAGMEEALEHNRQIDALDVVEPHVTGLDVFALAARMRHESFDIAIFPRPDASSHVVAAKLAKIPVRAGSTFGFARRFLTHDRPFRDDDPTHVVERTLAIAEAVAHRPLPRFPIELACPGEARQAAAGFLRHHGLEPGGFVVIHPDTGGGETAWGAAHYGELARRIAAETGLKVAVTGLEDERSVAQTVVGAGDERLVSLVGKTPLHMLAEVLREARMLVSGITGTLAVAASQGTPCVAIEPTPPSEIRAQSRHPWMVPHRVLTASAVCEGCAAWQCHGAGHACTESITVSRVTDAVLDLLRETAGSAT